MSASALSWRDLAIAFASDWTLVLMIPAAIVLHRGVVLREERYLEAKFGDPYRQYMARVPALRLAAKALGLSRFGRRARKSPIRSG